ncbi:MAG TPA: DUF4194 domain-containing protein [Clostridiales bacterium]|nr:DUF4194 domain-containing protein [Clostridiales bacterium]
MWLEEFERLTNSEKEEFKRIANLILSRTFIIRDIYDPKDNMLKINAEYRFVERYFQLFSDYLSYSGWTIYRDNNYGVIALENIYKYNRMRLNKNTTLMLYTLRLIFEEEREKVTLRKEIMTTTGQLIHKMLTIGLIDKKLPNKDIANGLRTLSYHNIIEKLEGVWEDPDTRILILPSILFVVTNERISKMYETLGFEDEEEIGEYLDSQFVFRGEDVL